MKAILGFLPALVLALAALHAGAQVPVVGGPGNVSLKELEGSPTLVTVVLKGERLVEDPNLTVKEVLSDALNVTSQSGDVYTYLFDSIAEVRIQGDVVEKAPIRLPLSGALRSEDQRIVDRAAARARDLFTTVAENQEVKLDAAVLVHLHEGSGGADARQYLEQLVETNDLQTQVEAAVRLFLAGQPVPEQVLTAGLQSGNRKVRVMAIELAGLTGYQEGTPMLIQALNDRADDLSAPAAIALARLGNREIIPRLLNMIQDSSPQKGEAAVDALVLLGGEDIVEQMQMKLPDAELQDRFRIIKVLYLLGDPQGRRLLQETQETVTTLSLEAAILLAERKDEAALSYLRRRLTDRMDVNEVNLTMRSRMAAALLRGNDPNAISHLQELLRSELPSVRVLVCDLVLELGDRRLLVILQPVIESEDPVLSLHACMSALGFGYPPYRERLLDLRE